MPSGNPEAFEGVWGFPGLEDLIQFRRDSMNSFFFGGKTGFGQIHGDGLPRVDRNGVENDLALTAMHIERIEQVLHPDVVRGQSGRVVVREAWRGSRYGPGWISIVGGVD